MAPSFTRLVRFKSLDGQIYYGEAGDQWQSDLKGKSVKIFSGLDPFDEKFHLSDKSATISEVLCPLESVPIGIGIGLNYRQHAEEAGLPFPTFPVVFAKYPDTLAGPFEDVPVNPDAHFLDYEGELTLIIGKDIKDLTEQDDPLDYVLGYTVGNDVSSRYWQRAPRSGGQYSLAKSFDKFGPIGPVIASLKAVGNPEDLKLRTWVNGELRQESSTDDLIIKIKEIIRHLSKGTTLRKGTYIMTGTPSGVAAFMKPPRWLQDGDVVEVEIEKIGKIANKMVFRK
ncbi:aromatic compound degradation protein [Leptodontidium sp. MPI-SDFR-AT-0119]|nr:aromatic compound degradation protein [Leptodontidium sp. MPI-SDFR-AT-0119]